MPASPEFGYGVQLIQAVLALAAVCLLAWMVLRWSSRRGSSLGRRGGRIQIIERAFLDPRRSLYLVRMGERVLLLGTGDGAAPSLIAELRPDEVPALEEGRPSVRFSDLFRGLKPRA